jgi:hypothetical protein
LSKILRNIYILPSDDIIGQDNSDFRAEIHRRHKTYNCTNRKTTTKLDPIEFEGNDPSHDNEVLGGLGFTPFFWYNGYQVSDRDISSLNLY